MDELPVLSFVVALLLPWLESAKVSPLPLPTVGFLRKETQMEAAQERLELFTRQKLFDLISLLVNGICG